MSTNSTNNGVTQTLFRFINLRSPELTNEKEQDVRFVLAPAALRNNHFFEYVIENENSRKKQTLLSEYAVIYKNISECFQDKNSIETQFPGLFNLAIWVAKNKETYEFTELRDRIEALTAESFSVSPEQKLVLWNNLIYQVATQKDFYIKEYVMQMLLAVHLFENSEDEEKDKILRNARIVLPRDLILDESDALPVSPAARTLGQSGHSSPSESMQKQQNVSFSKKIISRLDKLSKEIDSVEKKYRKGYQKEYKISEAEYKQNIAPLLEEYNQAVQEARKAYCSNRRPEEEYNPNDPCSQPEGVPYPEIPEFQFEYDVEISAESLLEKLKSENLETLLYVLGFDFNNSEFNTESPREEEIQILDDLLSGIDTFEELRKAVADVYKTATGDIIQNVQEDFQALTRIGGMMFPVEKIETIPFTYQLCPRPMMKCFNFDLFIDVPDASWEVSDISYTLHDGSNDTTGNFYNKTRIGNRIFLNDFFSDLVTDGVIIDNITDFSMDISVSFTNGQTVNFTAENMTARTCYSSSFEFQSEFPENEDFIPSGFGFKQLGIADYLKVEQTTHAYVEGEVAHIENIMAREYREKSTRRLRRSENTSTTSSDTEREKLTDTTTSSRFEMQSEIAKMAQEARDSSVTSNIGASWKAFNTQFTLGLGAAYANHSSKEESTRQAVTQAQDITARALDRVVTKVHEERIEKIIEEFEENNSHGLDNRKGDKHVVGVYRWVDKLMKNQIYNYGKRLMFEFMIPEPARLHLYGMTKTKSPSAVELIKPEDPRTSAVMQMKDYSALENEVVLKYWTSKYGVEIDTKPCETKTVGVSFAANNNTKESGFTKSSVEKVKIPEGYYSVSSQINIGYECEFGPLNYLGNGFQAITVANNNQVSNILGNVIPMPKYTEEVPVSYFSIAQHGQASAVMINLQLLPEYKNAWLQKTFNAIISAYENALTEYMSRWEEEQNKAVVIKGQNPNYYREIENTILRKNCISYLIDRTSGSPRGYGLEDLTIGSSFMDYETNLSAKLDKYSAFVKFMEQAFEWEILSYHLYPYYWGKKSRWTEMYQSDDTDPLFRSFLQSGMARVVVTVRPGFENAVQFFMATGKIWKGGEVPVIGDELYLSIVDEMKEPKGEKQGKAWITKLPTSLTILQAESIGLQVEQALPFTIENPEEFEVPAEVVTESNFEITGNTMASPQGRGIENIEINNDYLQLTTNDSPHQVVAQISIDDLKDALQ